MTGQSIQCSQVTMRWKLIRLVHAINNQGTNPATNWKLNRSQIPKSNATQGSIKKILTKNGWKKKNSGEGEHGKVSSR